MPVIESFSDVLSWASDLEPEARQQAIETASMPFVVKPIALMPDAHFGLGATVGSVVATQGAILPAAVGVDVGCGMVAVRLKLTSADLPDNLDALHSLISAAIPSGVGKGFDQANNASSVPLYAHAELTHKQEKTARTQMGTLGSGNHFVEVCLDEKDRVWIVLHSGSRGIGNQLAKMHIEKAKGLMKDWLITTPNPDLAYIPECDPAFKNYIDDLLWGQAYAFANRSVMMSAAIKAVNRFMGYPVKVMDSVNCHHNFAQLEHHHGKNVWVTRKGAIKAAAGDKGVIPGSMGAASYITKGLGNPSSYNSCSHGAGRRISRNKARSTFSVDDLRGAMGSTSWNKDDAVKLLDEHPGAYKNIDQVMANQTDLAKIVHTLHQILNYKGV